MRILKLKVQIFKVDVTFSVADYDPHLIGHLECLDPNSIGLLDLDLRLIRLLNPDPHLN
jgi:hypothetical protein